MEYKLKIFGTEDRDAQVMIFGTFASCEAVLLAQRSFAPFVGRDSTDEKFVALCRPVAIKAVSEHFGCPVKYGQKLYSDFQKKFVLEKQIEIENKFMRYVCNSKSGLTLEEAINYVLTELTYNEL
jgi:hypothetical protein